MTRWLRDWAGIDKKAGLVSMIDEWDLVRQRMQASRETYLSLTPRNRNEPPILRVNMSMLERILSIDCIPRAIAPRSSDMPDRVAFVLSNSLFA
jgi:hypothetical protein